MPNPDRNPGLPYRPIPARLSICQKRPASPSCYPDSLAGLALPLRMAELPQGLPRRYAPRNDGSVRHYEGRRPVAIQSTLWLTPAFRETGPLHGLPRRFAPRNDGFRRQRADQLPGASRPQIFTVFLYIEFSPYLRVWGLVSESLAQPASSVGIQARRTAFGVLWSSVCCKSEPLPEADETRRPRIPKTGL